MPRKPISEFRKDLIGGDWILIASGRKNRPHFFQRTKEKKNKPLPKKLCPFEDPQKSGNSLPILWYPKPGTPPGQIKNLSSWFIQVVPNKYPLLNLPFGSVCPSVKSKGLQKTLDGVGFHELIITHDHSKTIDKMTIDEAELLIRAYQTRYQTLAGEPCVNYILIFHNQGASAGASVPHPHSQLVAIPVVDPDLARSLSGARQYFRQSKECVHCDMLKWELEQKERIVYRNKHFVVLNPFAPRVSYETRIYPLFHASRFENITDEQRFSFADALIDALKRLTKVFGELEYNSFIHTAPFLLDSGSDYHWHMEIIPRGYSWAGVELGAGIEIVGVPPEESAENLRKAI